MRTELSPAPTDAMAIAAAAQARAKPAEPAASPPASPGASGPAHPRVMPMSASQSSPRRAPTVWRAVRRAAAWLRHVQDEQVLMWEIWWQANRASVPSSGPLTWVSTLDGHRLAGSHLPVPGRAQTGGSS
jgi:hypothetical protein